MNSDNRSSAEPPRIERIEWGRIELADGQRFRDAKLYPGGGREWDWNETGTRHEPGIQVADAEELIDHGAEVLVLSSGFWERLRTPEETRQILEARGCTVHVTEPGEAVDLYNRLRETEPVGALIHSTC